MKDGMDGETFGFKLKVIPLGLTADGEEESSCVIEHVDTAPERHSAGKQKPSGAHQVALWDLLKVMAPSGSVNFEDLAAGYAKKMPVGENGRDLRKRDAKRALDGLVAKKLAFMQENDRVSLTSLITSGDDGWINQ